MYKFLSNVFIAFTILSGTAVAQCLPILDTQKTSFSYCRNDSSFHDLRVSELKKGGEWFYHQSSQSPTLKTWDLDALDTFVYHYSGSGCDDWDTVVLHVNNPPEIKLTSPGEVCENTSEFSLFYNAHPLEGTWFDTSSTRDYVKDSKFYPGIARANGQLNQAHLIGYWYKDTTTGCIDTAYTKVIVKALPVVELIDSMVKVVKNSLPVPLMQFVKKVKNRGEWKGKWVNESGNDYYFGNDSLPSTLYTVTYTYRSMIGNPPHCANSINLTIWVADSLKPVNIQYESADFQVFPNPGNQINIQSSRAFSYSVYNLQGQIISEGKSDGRLQLNLKTGNYILRARLRDGRIIRKWMVFE